MLRLESPGGVLNKAITIAAKLAPAKALVPVLSNVMIKGTDEGLEVWASDHHVWLRMMVPDATILEKGAILVRGKRIKEISAELKGEDVVRIVQTPKTTVVSAPGAKFTLAGPSSEDYPPFPEPRTEDVLEVEANLLVDMIERSEFVVQETPGRFCSNGLLLKAEPGALYCVGANNSRVSIVKQELEGLDVNLDVLIPYGSPEVLLQMLKLIKPGGDEDSGLVELRSNESFLFVKGEGWELALRLVSGNFPPWKGMTDISVYDHHIEMDNEELARALRRSMLLDQTDTKAVMFSFKGSTLTLETRAAEAGVSVIEVPLVNEEEDEDFQIAMNPAYVRAGLAYVPNIVTLRFRNGKSPVVLHDKDPSGLEFTYFVVPINLGRAR